MAVMVSRTRTEGAVVPEAMPGATPPRHESFPGEGGAGTLACLQPQDRPLRPSGQFLTLGHLGQLQLRAPLARSSPCLLSLPTPVQDMDKDGKHEHAEHDDLRCGRKRTVPLMP